MNLFGRQGPAMYEPGGGRGAETWPMERLLEPSDPAFRAVSYGLLPRVGALDGEERMKEMKGEELDALLRTAGLFPAVARLDVTSGDSAMSTVESSMECVASVMREALAAGTAAGNLRIRALAMQETGSGAFEDCGGSVLHIGIDRRTRLGKAFASTGEEGMWTTRSSDGGFVVNLKYPFELVRPVNGQEYSISYSADLAAAAVLEERLGVHAVARLYID